MNAEEQIDCWHDFSYESGGINHNWDGILVKISPTIKMPTSNDIEVFCDILSLISAETHPYVTSSYTKPTPGYGKYIRWVLPGLYMVPANTATLKFFGMNRLVKNHIATGIRKH